MVENPPANAGDTGLSPGLGRSHMPRSNWAREPQLLSLRVWSLCSATREAATVRDLRTAMKSGPRLPQLEKALAQKRRPNTAKKKQKKQKNSCYLNLLYVSRLNSFSLRGQELRNHHPAGDIFTVISSLGFVSNNPILFPHHPRPEIIPPSKLACHFRM